MRFNDSKSGICILIFGLGVIQTTANLESNGTDYLNVISPIIKNTINQTLSDIIPWISVLSLDENFYNLDITYNDFANAIKNCGYNSPDQVKYNSFIKNIPWDVFSNRRELAMFLAQVIHESGGLAQTKELACEQTNCPGSYRYVSYDIPGQYYYGRGYMQLTWSYNYLEASLNLFHDYRLLYYPDLVSNNGTIAWLTGFWYWNKFVHRNSDVLEGNFGASTRIINSLECGRDNSAALKRFQCYASILPALGINETPISIGCSSSLYASMMTWLQQYIK